MSRPQTKKIKQVSTADLNLCSMAGFKDGARCGEIRWSFNTAICASLLNHDAVLRNGELSRRATIAFAENASRSHGRIERFFNVFSTADTTVVKQCTKGLFGINRLRHQGRPLLKCLQMFFDDSLRRTEGPHLLPHPFCVHP